MARNIWLLALLVALSTLPRVLAQDVGHYETLVNDNTRFAFTFFRQSLAQTSDRNVIIAPTALSTDFSFLQNGADTNAREEILHAFDLDNLSKDEINQQNSTLRLSALFWRDPCGCSQLPHSAPNSLRLPRSSIRSTPYRCQIEAQPQ
jgi:hypothetical protein